MAESANARPSHPAPSSSKENESEIEAPHASHFASLEQEIDTNRFGMWVFLMTELMLFGGLFAAYTIYRIVYPGAFVAGSSHLNRVLAGINTVVLITSGLTMTLADRSARLGEGRRFRTWLVATIVLGALFLVLKGYEYSQHFAEGLVPGPGLHYSGPYPQQIQLFLLLYYLMTGVHAIHLAAGIVVVVWVIWISRRGVTNIRQALPIELASLYWHFVDVVWVFLFALLYLAIG